MLLGLILGHAVALLQLALELIALAVDGGEVVVGELAPLLLDLARQLFPITLDAILIHDGLPICGDLSSIPGILLSVFVDALMNPREAVAGRFRFRP